MDQTARHLRLLTETIAAVNSTLDLEEVFDLIARKVAEALETDACFVYLYDEGSDELVLRASFGTRVEEMTRVPKMRPGEGITGSAAAERAPVMIPRAAHLDPRFKSSREFSGAEIDLLMAIAGQVAQAIENAKLYEAAQQRVAELEALASISEAVSESLYLEESLEAIVKRTMEAVGATGAALVLEDGTVAWPEGRSGKHATRVPLRWRGREIGELVCDRDTPFTVPEERLLASIAHHAAVAVEHGRAVMRGVVAQEIHHRVKNNLQTVASLLRLQARSGAAEPDKALADSVNRILAIAAVHEVLTERRDEDVDLGELVERLRAMLVQGLGGGKRVESHVEPILLHGGRATALALVFSELLQNALEHGGNEVRVELGRNNGQVCLTVADNGSWSESKDGTGLSIVRALVRDELKGTLSLTAEGGLRAEVAFLP